MSLPIAQYLEHTLLRPDATAQDIMQLCAQARAHRFASVCVNSCYTSLAASELQGTHINIATVVGFPLGASTSNTKKYEAYEAAENGATELDMVVNVGAVKAGTLEYVRNDIRSVINVVRGRVVKVILETGYLTPEEIRTLCRICAELGVHYVKTSTGFGPGKASVEEVKMMKSVLRGACRIKASGGIRTFKDAVLLLQAGAARLGTSSSMEILRQADEYEAAYLKKHPEDQPDAEEDDDLFGFDPDPEEDPADTGDENDGIPADSVPKDTGSTAASPSQTNLFDDSCSGQRQQPPEQPAREVPRRSGGIRDEEEYPFMGLTDRRRS
jgi:deoxyribose-phosphate aldolase